MVYIYAFMYKRMIFLKYPLLLFFLFYLSSCNLVLPDSNAKKKTEEGLVYFNTGMYAEAILSFKAALKIPGISDEVKSGIYRNIAQVFIEANVPDSAIFYSIEAAKCNDLNSYNYLVNMADVDVLSGRTAKAEAKLLQAYKLNPNELPANNSLGLIYMGNYGSQFINYKKALPYNQRAYEINSDRNTAYVLALNHFELENYSDAEEFFQMLRDQFSENALYAYMLALTKSKLNNNSEARLLFNSVLELDSSYAEAIANWEIEVAASDSTE